MSKPESGKQINIEDVMNEEDDSSSSDDDLQAFYQLTGTKQKQPPKEEEKKEGPALKFDQKNWLDNLSSDSSDEEKFMEELSKLTGVGGGK